VRVCVCACAHVYVRVCAYVHESLCGWVPLCVYIHMCVVSVYVCARLFLKHSVRFLNLALKPFMLIKKKLCFAGYISDLSC